MRMPPGRKDCPDRSAECHTTCAAYKEFRAKCDEDIKERRKETMLNDNPHIRRIMRENEMRQKRGR